MAIINVTYNGSNKKELKVDGTVALKAASGKGEAILTEIYKFAKGEKFTTPKQMFLVEKQKAWLTQEQNTIVLFVIADDVETANKANSLVQDFVNQNQTKEFSTTVGGIITTDEGVALSTDKGQAIQLHESKEKNHSS